MFRLAVACCWLLVVWDSCYGWWAMWVYVNSVVHFCLLICGAWLFIVRL